MSNLSFDTLLREFLEAEGVEAKDIDKMMVLPKRTRARYTRLMIQAKNKDGVAVTEFLERTGFHRQ